MAKPKIKKDEKYEYMFFENHCLIFQDKKRITMISIPDVEPQDLDIRIREIIICKYGIKPENLSKSQRQFVKSENRKNRRLI